MEPYFKTEDLAVGYDGSILIHTADLPVYSLHHRFIFSVFCLENLNKLFGTYIIRKRPQTFARSA